MNTYKPVYRPGTPELTEDQRAKLYSRANPSAGGCRGGGEK